MDTNQSHPLYVSLLTLIESSTTPKKDLKLFSSSCFALEAFGKGDKEPVLIFLAYLRFLIRRRPSAIVTGIWEEILLKAFMYSTKFSRSQIKGLRRTEATEPAYDLIEPAESLRISNWLSKALLSKKSCPNSYTRLKLFSLIRIFFRRHSSKLNWENLSHEFMLTIHDINPKYLNPSDNIDDDVVVVELFQLMFHNKG